MTKPPQAQLHGLSKKSDELRRTHLLRVNPTSTLGTPPSPLASDKISYKYVRGEYYKRQREANEALAVNKTAITRPGPYRTGDGDFQTACRPRADDHKKYKSLTTGGTITYPRGHQ
jgi:hypothetical protein